MAALAEFIGPGRSDPEQHTLQIFSNILPNEGDLLPAGHYLRGQIRDLTFGGISLDGGTFAPYSEAYAKKKGQTNVDLYSRGASKHMLDALTVHTTDQSIELGIFGDGEMATRAKAHNEGATIRTKQSKSGKPRKPKGLLGLFADIGFDSSLGSTFAMPRREWLGATPDDLGEMTSIITRSIADRIERI